MRSLARFLGLAVVAATLLMPLSATPPARAAGELEVLICAGPYALVDANKPGEEGPMVLTICARVTNTSGSTCEDINVYIGDGATPGTFPLGSDSTTQLSTPWCPEDDTRYIPQLADGESRTMLWQVAYPSTFDVVYDLTVWAESQDGTCDGSDTHQLTTRSSLTAAANKVLGTVSMNPPSGVVSAGNIVEVTVTGFNFGQVGPGPSGEEDIWLQPVGNLDFDPCCFRLVSTEVYIDSIDSAYPMPASNRLYYPGIGSQNPAPNYNADPGDYVIYRFIALSDCATIVQAYQEGASGNVEKYSGDYDDIGVRISVESNGSAIELEKTVDPPTGDVGDTLTWTISYTNTSGLPVGDPDSGAGLVVIDQGIPDGTVYVSGSADCSDSCIIYYSDDDGATWDISEPVDPGDVDMIKWYITEAVPAGEGGSAWFDTEITSVDEAICNSAVAQIQGGEPIASTSVCANVPPEVEADKVDAVLTDNGDGYVGPGDVLTYTVTITADCDTGATALAVVYNDVLDPNVTLVDDSITTTQGTVTSPNNAGDPSVAVAVGNIAACDSVTISYQVTVNASLPAGVTHIENQGTVTGLNFPAEPTDDPDTDPDDDPTVVLVTSAPDIEVLKTDSLDPDDDLDDDGVPSPGDILTYEVVVTNNGNQDGLACVLIDAMPDYTTLVVGSITTTQGTITKGNTAGDTMVEVDLGTIQGDGDSATVTFQVQIDNVVPADVDAISNQALVTGDNFPPELSDDPDTQPLDDPTETYITAAPDLEVYKRATAGPDLNSDGYLNPGEVIIYTVTITNLGNQEAGDVVFTDTPDANTTLVVGSVMTSQGNVVTGNTAGDTDVDISVGTVDVGSENQVEISFTVLIESGEFSQVENHGQADGDNFEDEPSDDPETPADDDPTVSPISSVPLLEVYKTGMMTVDADGSGDLSMGDTVTYTVTITNNGTGPATDLSYDDTPDSHTSLVVGSVTTSLGSVDVGNDAGDTTIEVDVGTVHPGVTVTISYQVSLGIESVVYPEIENQGNAAWGTLAVMDEDSDDPATGTDDDPTILPVHGEPLLDVEKYDTLVNDADSSGTVTAGDTIEYVVTISNSGTEAATGVTFEDHPDANTALVAGTVNTTSGTIVEGDDPGETWVEVTIPSIAPAASVTIDFDVLLLEGDYTLISNQGLVDWEGPVPGDEDSDDPDTGNVPGDPTDTPVYSDGEPPLPPKPVAVGGEAMRPDRLSIISGILLLLAGMVATPLILRKAHSAR